MAVEGYANTYSTTLADAGGITSSATTLTLASATGAPAAPFRILVESELILVGARTGTACSSLTRGSEGTTAAAHAQTVAITHVLTAASLLNSPGAMTAQGDLQSLDASGTVVRLAVGPNGQVLVADATQTLGFKWAPGGVAHGCRAYRSTDQTGLVSGAETAITLDTEAFDTDAFHDPVTNTSRFTVPSGMAGKYIITATLAWTNAATGERQLRIRVNGTMSIAQSSTLASGSYFMWLTTSATYSLAVGDYVEMTAYQDSGANSTVKNQGVASPMLSMLLVGT